MTATTDQIAVRYEAAGSTTFGYANTHTFATGNWYYYILKVNAGGAGNDLVLTIYGSDGTQLDTCAIATIADLGNYTEIRWGQSYGSSGDIYIDDVRISNDINRDMHAIRDTVNYPG